MKSSLLWWKLDGYLFTEMKNHQCADNSTKWLEHNETDENVSVLSHWWDEI